MSEHSLPDHLGWANYPTWATFNWLTCDETAQAGAAVAAATGVEALKAHVLGIMCAHRYGLTSDLLEWAFEYVDFDELHRALAPKE